MCRAFPGSDYYEGSVTIGVSPRRPSRVPLTLGLGLVILRSMDLFTPNPALSVLLVDLVLSVVVGGGVGLGRWLSLPRATRGHPVGPVLRWVGFLIGFSVLRMIVVTFVVWV